MTSLPPSARSDDDLLSLAKTILREHGFVVESSSEGIELLVAENRFFIVVVAATNTIENLILAAPIALEALSKRVALAELGPKKWDTYLVMLTQEKSSEDDDVTRDLYGINYDTSRLRRIVHTGVSPVREAIGRALAPFIEPVSPGASAVPVDALDLLHAALGSRGVDAELANRAISAFKQGGSLDDIL